MKTPGIRNKLLKAHVRKKRVRKIKKPTDTSWHVCDGDPFMSVIHGKSGLYFSGIRRLREVGNFFLKAADYLESQHDK